MRTWWHEFSCISLHLLSSHVQCRQLMACFQLAGLLKGSMHLQVHYFLFNCDRASLTKFVGGYYTECRVSWLVEFCEHTHTHNCTVSFKVIICWGLSTQWFWKPKWSAARYYMSAIWELISSILLLMPQCIILESGGLLIAELFATAFTLPFLTCVLRT